MFKAVLWLNRYCFLFLQGVEETNSLEKALRGVFEGELQGRDVDLMEALPPPFLAKGSWQLPVLTVLMALVRIRTYRTLPSLVLLRRILPLSIYSSFV